MAISHANSVLDWMANLSAEDVPDEAIWPFPEELEEWFDMVRARHEAKYGGGGD